MSEKKIISVIGATGAQGGGLARGILADPSGAFSLRAVTRNPDSEKGRELSGLGAEVVAADLDDQASLVSAFEGSYGAFCVTNFWEHMSAEKELAQAEALASAAQKAKVQHVIWSTLEDTRKWVPLDDDRMPTLYGKYKVPHFDAKGQADAFFSDLPTTYLLTSFYWDNFIHFGMGPQPGEDGVLGIMLPMGDAKLPGIAGSDIGRCAFGVFQAGDAHFNKRVGIAGGHLTGQEMADGLAKLIGKPVRYNAVTPEFYRGLGFPGADDLGNMFQYNRDFSEEFCAVRSIDASKSLYPGLQSFEQWLQNNAAAFASL